MRVLILVALLVAAASGCGDDGASANPESPGQELDCSAREVTDLGVPSHGRVAHFTSSGGPVQISVSDLPGGILLEGIDRTVVWLGDGNEPPVPSTTHPKRPVTSRHELVVGLEAPQTVELTVGRWWLTSARGGRIRLAACPGVTISDVQAPEPDGREVFDVPPDPPTGGGPSGPATPGTGS